MSQVTKTDTPLAVVESDFKVINKSTIIARRFFRNKSAVAGLVLFLAMFAFGYVGQFFAKYSTNEIDYKAFGDGITSDHWFGTTVAGTDLFAQMVEAVRASMLVGVLVGTVSVIFAAMYGCMMAYFGGWIDKAMLFFLETMIMVPSILILAIAMNSEWGKNIQDKVPSWLVLSIVLIIFNWMAPARLIRAVGQSLITRDYVKAARYMGVHPLKIVWRHLVPNLGSLLILDFTRGITYAVIYEVSFSFIGIGIRYPNYSLGSLIAEASPQLNTLPHMFWIPVIFFLLLVAPLALINDGLRDAFDPTSMSVGSIKKEKKDKKQKTAPVAKTEGVKNEKDSESTKKEEVKNS